MTGVQTCALPISASVRDKVKAAGGQIINIEGEGTGEWVLVDLGDRVVHIMQPAIRAYYRLEELWGDKEVKFGAAKRATGLARKSAQKAPDDEAKPAPAKKAASKRAPVEKVSKTTSKTATKTASKTASKTGAKKVAIKKIVGKTASKKTPAKKARPPAKKTVRKSTSR